MSTLYGNFNDDGQLVLEGENTENGKTMKTRSTTTRVDDNTLNFVMEMSTDGKTWFANMDMTYSRAD